MSDEGALQNTTDRPDISVGLYGSLEPPGHPAIRSGSIHDASGIRPRAYSDLPDSCLFHCRCHCGVRVAGIGSEILRCPGKKGPLLLGGQRIRDHFSGLLLHGAAPVCGYLYPRSGHRTGHGVPVFWSGHQCACHFHDGQDSRLAARSGPGNRGRLFCRDYRTADGPDIPKG